MAKQRKLWCAFSDDIDEVFSIECALDIDTIDDIKKSIWKTEAEYQATHWSRLRLYSPANPVMTGLAEVNLVHLHPRKQVSSEFPRSADPNIDIIIIRKAQQQPTNARSGMLHFK